MRVIVAFFLGFGLSWLTFSLFQEREQQLLGPEGLTWKVKLTKDKEINELRKTVAEQAAFLESKNATIERMNKQCHLDVHVDL